MVREIMRGEAFLTQKAEPAATKGLAAAQDLLGILTARVQCQNDKFQTRFKTLTGWMAQIIQHEIDYCEGVLI